MYQYNYRYEAFNALVRIQNIFSNKKSPSKDIAYRFSVIEHMRMLCQSRGYINPDGSVIRYTIHISYMHVSVMTDYARCGEGLIRLYNTPEFQSFINYSSINTTELLLTKEIYQPGCLRKV